MEFDLRRDSETFLTMLGNVSSGYRDVRRLHFHFDFHYPWKAPSYCEFTMDLAPRSASNMAGGIDLINCNVYGYRESLVSELGRLYKTTQARPGHEKLRMVDFRAVREAVLTAWARKEQYLAWK